MADAVGVAMQENAIQVWNNAVFDSSSSVLEPLRPVSVNRIGSLGLKNSMPAAKKPVKKSSCKAVAFKTDDDDDARDYGDTCEEIERVEEEIARLSKRLKELKDMKIKKAASCEKPGRGRVVPAKFMEPSKKRGHSIGPLEIFATPTRNGSGRTLEIQTPASRKRCVSIGPLEILATPVKASALKPGSAIKNATQAPQRRGVSLGPMEIDHGSRKMASKKPDQAKERGVLKNGAPSTKYIADKKSALLGKRLDGIEEDVSGEAAQQSNGIAPKKKPAAARSASTSPKSRHRSAASALSDLRKGTATVGAKKTAVKRDDAAVLAKPKVLFPDGKHSVAAARKPKARVVASRYSLAPAKAGRDEPDGERRKWSLPELNSEDEDASADELKTPMSIAKVRNGLPKIKNLRCVMESPRDSGCAKRVAELANRRRSIFDEPGNGGRGGVSSYQSRAPDDEDDI